MVRRTRYRDLVLYIVLFAFVSACTTIRPVEWTDSASVAGQIEAGDKVEVRLKDGSVLKFKVTEVTDERLLGRNAQAAFVDMEHLEVVERSVPLTVFWVLAAVAAVVIIESYECGAFTLEDGWCRQTD
jgi:hypothetical protein